MSFYRVKSYILQDKMTANIMRYNLNSSENLYNMDNKIIINSL